MMRNLVRVLLVSSALVAVSVPSAYATPGDLAVAASNPAGGAALATQAAAELAALGTNATTAQKKQLLLSAVALCNGNAACVLALTAVFAAQNVTVTRSEIVAAAAAAGVQLSNDQLANFAVGSVGGAPAGTTPDSSGSSGDGSAPSTGTPPSAS
jgi:hypothetical protein